MAPVIVPARNCGCLLSQASLKLNARPLLKSVICTFPILSINPLSYHLLSTTTITTLTNTPWKVSTYQTPPPSGPLAKTRPLYGPKRRA
jgi:hypothetical protein